MVGTEKIKRRVRKLNLGRFFKLFWNHRLIIASKSGEFIRPSIERAIINR